MRGRKSRSNVTLVIEQAREYLQLFQIEEQNHQYIITNYQHLDLALSSLELCRLVSKLKLKTNQAKIAIADSLTIRKSIEISELLNAAEQHELAQIEVAKYMQNSLDKVCFDYQILQHADKHEMLLVIAKRQPIQDKASQLMRLGLRVNSIDIESNCISRLLAFVITQDYSQTRTAVLDVSNGKIKIFIIKDGQLIFTNTENYLIDNLQTPELMVDEILIKIDRNFKYFYATKDNLSIQFVYLYGNFKELALLNSCLNLRLNIKVVTLNLSEMIQLSKKFIEKKLSETDSGLALALGLALEL